MSMLTFATKCQRELGGSYITGAAYVVGAAANDGEVIVRVAVCLRAVGVRAYKLHQYRERITACAALTVSASVVAGVEVESARNRERVSVRGEAVLSTEQGYFRPLGLLTAE